jgi:hypothetical protein
VRSKTDISSALAMPKAIAMNTAAYRIQETLPIMSKSAASCGRRSSQRSTSTGASAYALASVLWSCAWNETASSGSSSVIATSVTLPPTSNNACASTRGM